MRVVGRGGSVLDPSAAERVIKQIRRGNVVTEEDRLYGQLSEREQVILGHIAEGLTNREIADLLYLSEKTIKHHVSDILSKLGMSRRVDAAVFVTRQAARHFEEPQNEGRQ
jgi:DNA-binding NarL/FixJ family response regulator